MPEYYRILRPGDGMVITCNTPEAAGAYLRIHADWLPGRYDVRRTASASPLAPSPGRWGVAVKHPDGTVELVPDGP